MGFKERWKGITERRSGSESNQRILKPTSHTAPLVVAITGTTGNLGAYLLDHFMRNAEVAKIYCLNRSSNAWERQARAHVARGLSTDFHDGFIEFLQVDLEHEKLGLDSRTYEQLAREVTTIVHNAWPVDFNRNFHSFKPSIDGVSNLMNLAIHRTTHSLPKERLSMLGSDLWLLPPLELSSGPLDLRSGSLVSSHNSIAAAPLHSSPPSTHTASSDLSSATSQVSPIQFVFVSSVGAASNWSSHATSSRDKVPEAELTDWKLARTGYGQSKLFSERLLAYASRNLGLPVSVMRVGQLGGPITHGEAGAWPPQEWLPSLIKSSFTLGALPESLGPTDTVDWIPVDIAAKVVVELAESMAAELDGKGNSHTDLRGKETFPASLSLNNRKSKPGEASFYSISNPCVTCWSELTPSMRRYMPADTRTVTFIEWVELLKQSVRKEGYAAVDESANPAAKLLDFFENLQDKAIRFPDAKAAVLETKATAEKSPTLARVGPVSREWVELWMRQWDFGETEKDNGSG